MTLSPQEKVLLVALRNGRHFKANPAEAKVLLRASADDANPVARRIVALGFARRVVDSERPGAMILRLSDAGLSEADKIADAERKLTLWERIKQIPFGKGLWDLAKIGFGVVLGAAGTKYFGT